MSKTLCKECPVTTVDLRLSVGGPSPEKVAVLPKADFLVITWTEAEAGALALVFGDGHYSFQTAVDNNFTPLLLAGMAWPSGATFHGYFFQVNVNGKSVVCLKSEFHPKFQTAATTLFLEKIIGSGASPNFKYVVTSGTAGGIWAKLDVGDVVVTNRARYGMTLPKEKQLLSPFNGTNNVIGGNAPSGYASWYDYATTVIIQNDQCVNRNLMTPGGRKAASGNPAICYRPNGPEPTDVVTNSRMRRDECSQIDTYRKMGATLDENDAYVAEACEAIGFQDWVSIRNVSDLPCSTNGSQYDTYGFCSSINGAYAIWAFVMGH
jgi:hypothetical protein